MPAERVMIIAVRAEDGTVMEIWDAKWDGTSPKTSPNNFTDYKAAETVSSVFPMTMGTHGGPNTVQKSESWNVFSVKGSPGCTYVCTSSGCRRVCT